MFDMPYTAMKETHSPPTRRTLVGSDSACLRILNRTYTDGSAC